MSMSKNSKETLARNIELKKLAEEEKVLEDSKDPKKAEQMLEEAAAKLKD